MSLFSGTETIAALATIPGRSALAIVRLSGPEAASIGQRLSNPWPSVAKRAVLSAIRDPKTGELLDRGIIVRYDSPHSFTGEDVVEISTHGGSIVPGSVLAAAVGAGARVALPGEFTRRALLNGRLDLAQAEAILDLIDARSLRAQQLALSQLDGGLSRRIADLRSALLDVEALIAYEIDFPEEDDGPISKGQVQERCRAVEVQLEALVATAAIGEMVRDGAVVVLAGLPNVGKSSLFNALLGQNRAIVSDEPGTTRDAVEAVIDTGQWVIRLVDTAGLRQVTSRVEHLGVEMSERYLDRAALVLVCGDSGSSLKLGLEQVQKRTGVPRVAVRTKSDLISEDGVGYEDLVSVGYELGSKSTSQLGIIVSAETGRGLGDLVRVITKVLEEQCGEAPLDAPVLVRERHKVAIATALGELASFRAAWEVGELPAPIAGTHLHATVRALEEVIGAVGIEDVLDRVFSAFCVGK